MNEYLEKLHTTVRKMRCPFCGSCSMKWRRDVNTLYCTRKIEMPVSARRFSIYDFRKPSGNFIVKPMIKVVERQCRFISYLTEEQLIKLSNET